MILVRPSRTFSAVGSKLLSFPRPVTFAHRGMAQIGSSLDVFQLLRNDFNPDVEEIWLLALDSQLQLLSKYMIFRGTVNHCLIHPRDIFRWLVLLNASSFVLAHNHPSHDPTPSPQDIVITKKIYRIASILEIPLADHVIFTAQRYFSMADHGLLQHQQKTKKLLKGFSAALALKEI